jgi:hypothetical protein
VIAYKFLAAGRVATFSCVGWPEPGTWLEARRGLEPCVSGIHALHSQALLGWIDDELWTCELGGAIEDDGEVLVSGAGAALGTRPGMERGSAYSFARGCATRGGSSSSSRCAARVARRRRASSTASTHRPSRRRPRPSLHVCRSMRRASS